MLRSSRELPLPLGTQETSGGVNFSLFSRHASRVRLELFEHPEDAMAARRIELDPARHRTGSADIYLNSGKGPDGSINFLTCHDGFTLNDLVSYRAKHNEANGESNRDGTDANFSDNFGVEGETRDIGIDTLRKRQIKNFLLTLFISRGVPMLLGGDEFRRTQGGNNNAYCQDNETSWCDWGQLERHREIHYFVRGMIAFRRAHPVLSEEEFYTDEQVRWLAPLGGQPDWFDFKAKTLGCLIRREGAQDALLLLFNADSEDVDFAVPALPPGSHWNLVVDTSGVTPPDFTAAGGKSLADNARAYSLQGRSSAILLVRKHESASGSARVRAGTPA